jgi:hypothetical protein
MIELGENASDENSAQVSNAENSDNCDCFMFVLGEDKLGKNISLCGLFGSRKVLFGSRKVLPKKNKLVEKKLVARCARVAQKRELGNI